MINGKKVFAITLARGGSKKIEKKNIKMVCGKPLLQYTTDEVNKSKYIDDYIVSTDDNDIRDLCLLKLGVPYYRRNAENASDTAKSSDAIIEVVNEISDEYYYIVEVMCTNPLKTVADIDECIEMLDATDADSVVSVVRIWDHHPSRVKYIEQGELKDFYPEVKESRRQDLTPPAYIRNGSIYATTRETLLKTKIRLGGKVKPYIMPEDRTINIDEPIDLEVARLILGKRYGKS